MTDPSAPTPRLQVTAGFRLGSMSDALGPPCCEQIIRPIVMMAAPIDFKPPWIGVTPKERQQLEAELAQEVCLLHPLAALDREVVARRIDTDDILIAINPHLCECAQVHLTWSGKTEMNPEVPSMELQATFQDWVQERMLPDHKAYTEKAAG